MRNKILLIMLGACVPALLSAGTLTATVTTTIPTIDDYLFFLGCTGPIGSCTASAPGAIAGDALIGLAIPPVTSEPITETVPSGIVSGYVTAIGLAAPVPSLTGAGVPSDVVIGLASGITVTGASWPFSAVETTIASELISGDTADLLTFFEANLADFVTINGPSGNIGEFSTGALRGSYSAVLPAPAPSVPEPGTLGLTGLLLGGVAFLNRRRFRRTS